MKPWPTPVLLGPGVPNGLIPGASLCLDLTCRRPIGHDGEHSRFRYHWTVYAYAARVVHSFNQQARLAQASVLLAIGVNPKEYPQIICSFNTERFDQLNAVRFLRNAGIDVDQ
jgi:hypothetical protein